VAFHIRMLGIAESPSPLVNPVETSPTTHISRMKRAMPPQSPSLLAPPLPPYYQPQVGETGRYKLHTRVAYTTTIHTRCIIIGGCLQWHHRTTITASPMKQQEPRTFRLIENSDGIKLTRPCCCNATSDNNSSPPRTRMTSTIPRMHASSLSDTQNRQDGDAIGDIHR